MGHFPYDAVVFDLDGTLFDAEEGIVSSVVKAMKEMGLEIPQGAQLRQVVGPPLRYSFHDLLNVPSERLDEAADRYAHIFRSEGMYRYSVYPGIRTMLRVLKENGIYVALASSKPRDLCERILRHYGLRHFFDRVIGETDSHVKLGKPEMIRRALPEHYERAAMVGDRLYDMEGAKAAGVDGVGAVYGCGSVEELQNAGATLLVSDADELRELLCPGAAVPRGFFLSMTAAARPHRPTCWNRVCGSWDSIWCALGSQAAAPSAKRFARSFWIRKTPKCAAPARRCCTPLPVPSTCIRSFAPPWKRAR